MSDLRVGDWVVSGLDIMLIEELTDDFARLKDDVFSRYTHSNQIRKLTIESLRAMRTCGYYKKEIENICGCLSLDWPNIHRFFSNACLRMIDHPKDIEIIRSEVSDFYVEMINLISTVSETKICGVNLFKK